MDNQCLQYWTLWVKSLRGLCSLTIVIVNKKIICGQTLANWSQKFYQENTHHRGKCHCKADLLFDRFGFDQTCKAVANSAKSKQLNPKNKIGGQPYSDTSPYVSVLWWSHHLPTTGAAHIVHWLHLSPRTWGHRFKYQLSTSSTLLYLLSINVGLFDYELL